MDPHVAEENIQALEEENSVEHHDPESTVTVVSAEEAEELSHASEEVEELSEQELAKQQLLNSWREEQSVSILDEVEHQLQASEEEEKAQGEVVDAEVPPAHTIIKSIERSSEEVVEDIPQPLPSAAAEPDTASSSDHIVVVPVVDRDAVDSTFRQGEDVTVIENPRSVPLATTEATQETIDTIEEKAEEKVDEAKSAVKSAAQATEEKVVEKKEEAAEALQSAGSAAREYVAEKKEEVVEAAKSVARSVEEQVPEERKRQAAAAINTVEEKAKSAANAVEEKAKSAANTAARKVDEVTKTVKREVQSVPQSQLNWGLVITGVLACTVVGGLIYYYNKNK